MWINFMPFGTISGIIAVYSSNTLTRWVKRWDFRTVINHLDAKECLNVSTEFKCDIKQKVQLYP